jgi:hypothetical protein
MTTIMTFAANSPVSPAIGAPVQPHVEMPPADRAGAWQAE